MTGPVGETREVATSIVDAFKNNPTCLAVVVLASLFSVLTFFALQRDADRRSELLKIVVERCLPPKGNAS
jgi:hypothetical protein